MREKVTVIRALLSEATEVEPPARSPESEARSAFERYASNEERVFYVDPAPRAKAIREVLRIAVTYNWPREVERALDNAGVMSLTSLCDPDLDSLLVHMRQLEDCARNALDPPDTPAAR